MQDIQNEESASMETDVKDDSELIKEGNYVILKTKKSSRLVQLNKGSVFVDKRRFECKDIIGKPWGQVFAMSGSCSKTSLETVSRREYLDHLFSSVDQVKTDGSGQDNRTIIDENSSQKMTREEIEGLKREGATSVDIVQSLVENSDTFQDKTNYSQQKYLKKKLKKYDTHIQACRPTVRSLAELYYSQSPLKIGMLRPDSLALMLCQANILTKGKYIVMDSYLGLLTAAVLERCPEGNVVQVLDYMGYQSSTRQAVQALGIESDRHLCVDYELVDHLSKGLTLIEECSEDPSNDRKIARYKKNVEALKLLQPKDCDGLLMSCRGDIVEPTLMLMDFLCLSRNFVIFSPHLEFLTKLYTELKSKKQTAMLKISETWLRRYQVLENRTHPEINMEGASGYLLTGIKVE